MQCWIKADVNGDEQQRLCRTHTYRDQDARGCARKRRWMNMRAKRSPASAATVYVSQAPLRRLASVRAQGSQ